MKAILREWIYAVTTFVVAFYFYSFIGYKGLEDFIQGGVLKDYFASDIWHIEIWITSLLLGTLFIFINKITDRPIFRKRSYGFNIFLKSILYFVSLIIIGRLVFYLFELFELISKEMLEDFLNQTSSKLVFSILLYCGVLIFFMNFMLTIRKKFGPRSMVHLFTGKYYHPRNEDIVFLFLDLKNSTSIAEKLGHEKYSKFIKQCVHELTPVIIKNKAIVYQYVGDEIVLYWPAKEGFKGEKCFKSFFEFCQILSIQKNNFQSNHGVAPTYKAGMDVGEVTLTEIGDIKREIAFHGDVLNTAARLEKKCNDYNEVLLISQYVLDRVQNQHLYDFKYLSELPLKGKTEQLKYYAVNQK